MHSVKKENTPLLETERLILRKFTDNDLDDMFLIYSDEEVNKFLPWLPFKSMEQAKNYLYDTIFAEYEKNIAYRYAVFCKSSKQVIGYVSICSIDEDTGSGDLGYGLRKEFWGRGIIAEASMAVLERLKENGFKFITATHDVNNSRSGKVMQKLGMSYRGSYDEMWQPKNYNVTFKLYRIDF